MKITKGDRGYLRVQTIADVSRTLYKELREECLTKESLFKRKKITFKLSVLKKSVESVEYRDRATTVFEVPNPIISWRSNVRLSDTPTQEAVGHIIKPKVDELINLARNRESVQKI